MTESNRRLRHAASLAALAGALALAACSPAPQTTDNALVDAGNAVETNDAAFNDQAPLVEQVSDASAPAVAVTAVPKPAAGASAAESQPLEEAGDIEEAIRAGTGVSRVRYGEGWAWMREGRILRTADRDGRNVAYFRGSDDRPFFVQQRDGRAWSYDNGKPAREWGRDGRVRAPDAERTREAAEAAREAGERRNGAEEARRRAGQGKGPGRDDAMGGGRPDRPQATPTPTPSPSPSASPTGRGNDRQGRPGWRDRPGASPSATPTQRHRRDGS